jgi:putative acetyltransferase
MNVPINYHVARTTGDFQMGKTLFEEYARSLDFDLSFQNFSAELETIHQQYQSPGGGLILALDQGQPIGCVGVRRLEPEIAELKRMYVRDAYRGRKIGITLLQQAIDLTRALGYKKLRLDTLDTMAAAQSLYRGFGFMPIPPYRFNPIPGTVYMEKALN